MRRILPIIGLVLFVALVTFQVPVAAEGSLEQRVNRLENQVRTLKITVSKLRTTVSGLDARVSALTGGLSDLTSRHNALVSAHNSLVSSFNDRTSKLDSFGNYNGDVDGYQVHVPPGMSCWGDPAVWSGTTGHLIC
ncbi:MAG: hypothetical protein AB1551_08810 [Actinomycetota bacterium]